MCAGEGTLDTMDDRVNTTMHSRDSDPNRGKIIAGRYTIVRTLGRGGMGKVLLVDDQLTGERVALKMLRAMHLANDQVVARFLREIDAVRRLDHPCIVKIYDAKHTDTELYYTMEYVRGISLRQWRQQKGNLAFASVTRVLCLVADGLEHGGFVHQTPPHEVLAQVAVALTEGGHRLIEPLALQHPGTHEDLAESDFVAQPGPAALCDVVLYPTPPPTSPAPGPPRAFGSERLRSRWGAERARAWNEAGPIRSTH